MSCTENRDYMRFKHVKFASWPGILLSGTVNHIPNKQRNAPLWTVHLSGRSQVIGQFSLNQFKGMSGTAASHVFCNQASKIVLKKNGHEPSGGQFVKSQEISVF